MCQEFKYSGTILMNQTYIHEGIESMLNSPFGSKEAIDSGVVTVFA
jgi:hypothetical protein